jgi:glycerate kinase
MQSARGKRRVATRPVLVCPDKFRGTFTADEVADAIAARLARLGIPADRCAIADGGEGTLKVVTEALPHEIVEIDVCDAHGNALRAPIAVLGDGKRAFVESATIIGSEPVAGQRQDAWAASSGGVGHAIAAATRLGVREVLIGIGGTVTTDGGAGALQALREHGLIARRSARGLPKRPPAIVALCDVRAAWLQAATVFAPQKGADPTTVARLGRRLTLLARQLPRDPRGQVMAGAGGGLAGGLWAAAGATLRPGAAVVLDLLDFTPRMLAARAVITGEGRLDRQTLLGKAVAEVATRARQAGVQCHAVVGDNAISAFDARILDFESVHAAGDRRAIGAAVTRLAPRLPTE